MSAERQEQPLPVGEPRPVPVGEPRTPGPSRGEGGGPSRRSWLALFFLIGFAGGYAVYDRLSTSGSEQAAAPVVRRAAVVKAVRGELRRTIRVGGTITAKRFAAITAPRLRLSRRVPGAGRGGGGSGGGSQMVLIAMAEPGADVNAGDVVAEFDRQNQQNLIDSQMAAVVQADAQIMLRRATLAIVAETTRQRERTARGDYKKAQLDVKTVEVRSAIEAEILKLTVEETEATWKQLAAEVRLQEVAHRASLRTVEIDRDQEKIDLVRAEMNADKMLLKTPVGGTVVMMTIYRGGTFSQVEQGDEIYPGAYFMQIVDPSEMQLEATLNQADAQLIRTGQEAEIRLDAYPGKVWEGRVVAVAAMAGGGGGRMFRTGTGSYVRNITVKIAILTADPVIIPDLSASADIVLEAHDNVVMAPREAVHKGAEGWFVDLRPPGAEQFVRRAIQLGGKNDTHWAVLGGLAEGDEVALRPLAEAAEEM